MIEHFPQELRRDYECLGVLGAGGMGVVFVARDRRLDRQVAVKCMRQLGQWEARSRFEREARILAGLRHPAVPQILQYGQSELGAFMVMDLLEGLPLSRVGDPVRTVPALLSVADALREVHALGICHRDVKPSNVFLTDDGRGYLLDFGLALVPDRTRITETGGLVGTLAYLAPEVLQGAPQSPVADWFGWGACLFHAFEGRPPYDPDVLLRHAGGDGELPRPRMENLPEGHPIEVLLLEFLDPDPAARPEDGELIREPLEKWLRKEAPGSTVTAATTKPAPPPPAPEPSRGRMRLLPLFLLLLGGFVLVHLSGGSRAPEVSVSRPPPGAAAGEAEARAALMRLCHRLEIPHRDSCEEVLCPLAFPSPEHIQEVSRHLLSESLLLDLEGLLDRFEHWYWDAGGRHTSDGHEEAHRLFSRLVAHLSWDVAELAVGMLPRNEGLSAEGLRRMAQGREIRNRAEDLFRSRLVRWLEEREIPDELLRALGSGVAFFSHQSRTILADFLRTRFLRDRTPETRAAIAAALLRVSQIHGGGSRCGLPPELLAEVVDALPTSPEPFAVMGLGSLSLYLVSPDAVCDQGAVQGTREILPTYLARFPDEIAIPIAVLDRLELLRKRILPFARDPDAYEDMMDLWWWIQRRIYLRGETRDASGRGWDPADADRLPAALDRAEEVLGDPAAPTASLVRALRGLHHPLLAALARGPLPANGETLSRILATAPGLLERVHRGSFSDPIAFQRYAADSKSFQWHLYRPYEAPEWSRVVIAQAFRELLTFPAALRIEQDLAKVSSGPLTREERAILREVSRRARQRSLDRSGAYLDLFRTLPPELEDVCGNAQGFARIQEEVSRVDQVVEFLRNRSPDRVNRAFASLTCVTACRGVTTCLDDPSLLTRWVEEVHANPTGPEQVELEIVCRRFGPGIEAGADHLAGFPEALARFRALCAR